MMSMMTMTMDCWGRQEPEVEPQGVPDGADERMAALKLTPSRVVAPRSFFAARRSRIELRCSDHDMRLLLELL